jgi:hypothetical protein
VAILNPGFEIPAASGVPGEAEDWTWASSALDQWAEWNTTASRAWQSAQERFEAGFAIAWTWTYADATARLAAGGFVAADAGKVARQDDDDSLWILQQAVPPIWAALAARNEDALGDLSETTPAATLFNGATSTYSSTMEMFELWAGPPHLDPPTYTRQDALGVGWRGWYDTDLTLGYPTPVLAVPLPLEGFSDGWGIDPWGSSFPGRWCPDTAPHGVLRGAPLAWPVTIRPNENVLLLWHALSGHAYRFVVPSAVYATATALAAAIQAAWGAALGGSPSALAWTAWTDGDDSGVALGYSGGVVLDGAVLGYLSSERSNDACPALGLAALGPGGARGAVVLPVIATTTPDPAFALTDYFVMDPWTQVDFRIEVDPALGNRVAPYGWNLALFNVFNPGPTPCNAETCELTGWFGPSAVYRDDFDSLSPTAAAFVGGVGAGAIIESFENPAVTWPSYMP